MANQRKQRRTISIFFLFGLCLLLFLGVGSKPQMVRANTDSDPAAITELQQKQQAINDYRSNVTRVREQLRNQEDAARDRLSTLQDQIGDTASKLETQETQLENATVELQRIEKDLAKAQVVYDKQQSSMAARLRFLQRQGSVRGWTALLQSRSFEELLDRRYQLKRVYASDKRSLVALKESKDKIEVKQLEVAAQKNRIALITEQLMTQKATYENRAQTEKTLVTRLNNDRQALEAAEQQLADESQRISQDIQQRLAARIAFPSTSFIPGTGRFIVPSEGPLTSSFGWRTHPILGTGRFHNGMDFGADQGSPIRAADNGVVIAAGWEGGYGNTVIIDHGNGLTTLYAHASELYVTVGQPVQRGQVVAAVGSTGFSTGPHLHFEVRQQGEPTDPIAYLQ
jgi:murein DD-endopeptidase MepM/ murein hydrolase activator NlpD